MIPGEIIFSPQCHALGPFLFALAHMVVIRSLAIKRNSYVEFHSPLEFLPAQTENRWTLDSRANM